MVHGEVDVGTVTEGDTFSNEFAILFEATTKGVRLGQLAIFGHYTVTGGNLAAWVGVEGVADPTRVAGAEGTGNVAVGGDVACGDLLDQRVNLIKKSHIVVLLQAICYFLANPLIASRTSIGTAKTMVLLASLEMSLMLLSVRRWRAPGDLASLVAASARFWLAMSSPSLLIIVALFSRSASACLAMVLTILSGSSISLSSTVWTSIPQSVACLSTIERILVAIFSLWLRSSSRVASEATRRMVVCASWSMA